MAIGTVPPNAGANCPMGRAPTIDDFDVDEKAIADQPHGGLINVFTPDAAIRDNLPEEGQLIPAAYIGMDRFEARTAVVEWFRQHGLLPDVRVYTHEVGHSYRSHVPIEPYLSDQWFVKMDSLVDLARRCYAEEHQVAFYPPRRGDGYRRRLDRIQLNRWIVYHAAMHLVFEAEQHMSDHGADAYADTVAELRKAVALANP